MVMIWHRIAHLWFWRDVEAKKTRVSVVVAALLVLVDLLLKHSQSSTEHATTIKFTTVIIQMRVFHLPNHHHRVSLFVNCLLFRLLVHTLNQQMIVIIRIQTLCRKMMILCPFYEGSPFPKAPSSSSLAIHFHSAQMFQLNTFIKLPPSTSSRI